MEEIWKDIEGFEGYYQVSNLGRIKSLDRYIIGTNGKSCLHRGKILCLKPNKFGYIQVMLHKNNYYKHFYLQKLVAKAFIPNPDNLDEVNHKDENKLNNCVDNLEWCDHKYNINYGSCKERISNTLKGRKMDDETKEKISKSQLGRVFSEETRRKLSESKKGKRFTKEHIRNMSRSNIGTIYVNNGKINKRIQPDEFDKYSELGFVKGYKFKKDLKQDLEG